MNLKSNLEEKEHVFEVVAFTLLAVCIGGPVCVWCTARKRGLM